MRGVVAACSRVQHDAALGRADAFPIHLEVLGGVCVAFQHPQWDITDKITLVVYQFQVRRGDYPSGGKRFAVCGLLARCGFAQTDGGDLFFCQFRVFWQRDVRAGRYDLNHVNTFVGLAAHNIKEDKAGHVFSGHAPHI